MDHDLVDRGVDTAAAVVAGGAISTNGHGNVSVRAPGSDEMYFSSGPSMKGLSASGVARVGLDGVLREGDLPPIQGAVVAMHTAMYADRDHVGCVIHTHSPYATAYAVAQRRIECWIEALAMFGLADGVPVAGYAPRVIRRCCWPTTACSSSIAPRSWRCSSAASSRRPRRPRSPQGSPADRSRSPRRCAPLRSSGRWRSPTPAPGGREAQLSRSTVVGGRPGSVDGCSS